MPKPNGPITVFVPNEEGEPSLIVGEFTLKDGKMEIEFEDNFPAKAVQRMLDRGEIFALAIYKQEPASEEDKPEQREDIEKENLGG